MSSVQVNLYDLISIYSVVYLSVWVPIWRNIGLRLGRFAAGSRERLLVAWIPLCVVP
jgi:hypothetical protein